MDAYARLLELVRRQRDLIAAGAWEELAAMTGEQDAALTALRVRPPAGARRLLEQADAQARANETAIAAARGEAVAALVHLNRGRAALHAYAGGDPSVFVDTRR
jgi:hypothetical protein